MVANFVASMHRSLKILTIKAIHILHQRDLIRRGSPVFQEETQRKPELLDPDAPKRRRPTKEQVDNLKNDRYSFFELLALGLYLSGDVPTWEPVYPIRLSSMPSDSVVNDIDKEETDISGVVPSREPQSPSTLTAKRPDSVVIDIDMEETTLSGVAAPSREPESAVVDSVVIDIDIERTNFDTEIPLPNIPWLPDPVDFDFGDPG